MLVELSKVEQRYDAVLSVIRDALTTSEAAIASGVSRQSVYRWMQRYEGGGLPGRPLHPLAHFESAGRWDDTTTEAGSGSLLVVISVL